MTHILRILGTLPLLGLLAASLGLANAAQIQLNSGAPFLCVTVEGGNTAPGTPAIAYSCSGGPEDQWQFINGQFQGIGTANGVSTCLDVQGGVVAAGALVVLNTCNGAASQQWAVTYGGGRLFTEISPVLGSCLDSSGGPSVGGGTQLVINPCSSPKSQNWIVRSAQFQVSSGPPYLCATVQRNKTASGTPVIASACNGGPGQLWDFENALVHGVGTQNGEHTCLTTNSSSPVATVTLSTCNGYNWDAWVAVGCAYGSLCGGGPQVGIIAFYDGGCLDSSGGPSVTGGTQLVINYNCKMGVPPEAWKVL